MLELVYLQDSFPPLASLCIARLADSELPSAVPRAVLVVVTSRLLHRVGLFLAAFLLGKLRVHGVFLLQELQTSVSGFPFAFGEFVWT